MSPQPLPLPPPTLHVKLRVGEAGGGREWKQKEKNFVFGVGGEWKGHILMAKWVEVEMMMMTMMIVPTVWALVEVKYIRVSSVC